MSRPGSGEVLDVLRTSPVFAGPPAPERESLAAAGREAPCRAREYVFHEGDPALWLCRVKAGPVRIVHHSRTGRDVVLELLGPGGIFGGVAVIAAHDSVTSLSVEPGEGRLAATLLRLAGREGVPAKREVALPCHLTRQSLADGSGPTGETAIRVVGRGVRDDLVEDRRGRLILRDRAALRSRAQGEAR